MKFPTNVLLGLTLSLVSFPASADEGMWLFNDLPKAQLAEKYGFTPSEAWAEHVMRASVRFNSGGSASFVSSRGLVLTNHHVGADTLQKLSTAERNLLEDGFLAKTPAEELPAPDLELNQLVSIEDVTERVAAAVKEGMPAAEAMAARRAVTAKIEKESLEATGLRSDVVTLYGGARHHLYRYKKYTDVRLVWAPESGIAFFGGDADNFEYPRYCLDVCIFRVYEDGKPARIEHFLKVSAGGVSDGEVVFVSGNPGRTQRIFTVAALKYQRDHYLPFVLDYLRRREILWQQFGLEGEEQARRAKDDLLGIQNGRKALGGRLQGLQTPAFFAAKEAEEKELRQRIAGDEKLKQRGAAWQMIEDVQKRRKAALGRTGEFAGALYDIAQQLVFLSIEDQKPSGERLREYRDSARESLLQGLFSPAPIYPDKAKAELADSMALFMERRGGDDELVAKALDGKSPETRAAELIDGTRLTDVDYRKQLVSGGRRAIEASDDPMIRLARLMEPEARRLRQEQEELAEIEQQAYSQVADVLFAIHGTDTYPDATFTLRLAFGPVAGYRESGSVIPPWTTIGGAFEHEKRHGAKDPWILPKSWHAARSRLNPETPMDFVCTADIIGGNSGSPVVNREAELVGVVFDGNIQSLTANYFYSDEQARAVSVDVRLILEALRKVYNAGGLAGELGR
ncbi:MAG: S46 family peptidase [Planctomycetaceae bacterium]|nr:S46 family peptidase [Planctomycetaceae bacterium]